MADRIEQQLQVVVRAACCGGRLMTIPDYQSLMRPLLEFSSDGSEKSIKGAVETLGTKLALSNDDLQTLLPSGKQTIFANRVHWARTYLAKAEALERTRRGHFRIADRGTQLLIENP